MTIETAPTAARQAWLDQGALPLPVAPDGTKRPAVKAWKQFQNPGNRPTPEELGRLWRADSDGIGILCGAASGGIEMLELEGVAVKEGLLPQLQAAFAGHGQGALWHKLMGGYMEITPSGGIHWYYRVQGEPLGNTKLASRPTTPEERETHPGQKIRVLIETRGEGGWSVVAPSAGRSHPTGKAWMAGPGRTPADIITITTTERDTIHDLCRTLDQPPAEETPAPATPAPVAAPAATAGLRPGDDFNNRASWRDILEPHGWRIDHEAGGTTYWIRPGKKKGEGVSATTGHSDDGQDRLYVFSTSTDLEAEVPYSKLGAYAALNHGGDHSAAASALRNQGYGDQGEPDTRTLILLPATGTEGAKTGGAALTEPTLAPVVQLHPRPTEVLGSLTDQGNADLMASEHCDKLRYEPSRGLWLQWEENRWAWCDDDGAPVQRAVETIRRISPTDKEITRHVAKSLSRKGVEACVALARRHPALRVANAQLDANPRDLNTPGGIVDLTTGQLRAARPEDWCTRATRVTPAGGTPERWLTFLADTFEDPELIAYVRRLAGYSAIGEVTHHILPFLYGSGGNGKSVFAEVLTGLLGEYASTAPPNFLMAGQQDESAIARLDGLRLVVSSEVAQSARFDEAKVKLLTGGDRITARFLYGRHFTYTPSVTLWLMGNHQPRVEAGGESFWRRLRLIPFTRTVPPEKRVEGLAKQLMEDEGPQILQWVIEGAVDILQQGMGTPDSVRVATQAYASEEDALGRFVADRLHLSDVEAARESTARVRGAYVAWCREEGEVALSAQAFGRELRARFGVRTKRSHGSRFYVGMTLMADPEDEPADDREAWS